MERQRIYKIILISLISVSLLVLGLLLVRNIMCDAISLSTMSIASMKSELEILFKSSNSEVVCIGATGKAVKMVPGKTNIIYCLFRSNATNNYSITVGTMKTTSEDGKGSITNPNSWAIGEPGIKSILIPVGESDPIKIAILHIPVNTPNSYLDIPVTVRKGTEVIYNSTLIFEVKRVNSYRFSICRSS